MTYISQIFSVVLRWGFRLALTGTLATATMHWAAEALSVNQQGLVSLTRLNQALNQPVSHISDKFKHTP